MGADLTHRAGHDVLTGLPNRRQLHERIAEILRIRSPQVTGFTFVLFCDLDYFKRVNDTYGHAAGDEVLKITAERLSLTCRSGDIVARLGGDEFVIVLVDVRDSASARAVAEKVRGAVSLPLPIGQTKLDLTVSIGVALADPASQLDRILENADAALYQAKHAGRDRIAMFDPSVVKGAPI